MLEIQFLNSKSSKNLKLFNVLKTTHILQQLSVILYKYCLHLFEFALKYTHKFEELKLATFWQLLLKRVFVRTLYWGGGGDGIKFLLKKWGGSPYRQVAYRRGVSTAFH